ncbi:hypothetical protein [Streptomyces sp. NPDC001502]|uniref:hypothetical protein n=1 Tax=Streptomyces sp. NPDC001502 TaxID=3364578 RepID=UPI0036CEF18F
MTGTAQPPAWPDCAGCGAGTEHLLSVTAIVPGTGRWLPLDDRGSRQAGTATPSWPAEAGPATVDGFGHGTCPGDLGGMYFFVCRSCPDTPYAHRYDC